MTVDFGGSRSPTPTFSIATFSALSTPKATPKSSPSQTQTPSHTPSPGSSLSITPSPTLAPSASPAVLTVGVQLPAGNTGVARRQLIDAPSFSEDAISSFLSAMSTSLGLDLSALSFDHVESVYDGARRAADSPSISDNSNLITIRPRLLASVLVGYKVFFNIAAAAALKVFGGSTASIANSVLSAISAASASGVLSAALASQPELATALGVTRAFLSSSRIPPVTVSYIAAASPKPSANNVASSTTVSLAAGVIAAIVLAAVTVVLCGVGYFSFVKMQKANVTEKSEKKKNVHDTTSALHIRSTDPEAIRVDSSM